VTGSADTSSATPVAGVTVAFKPAAGLGSCGTCGLHTAVTNAAGSYSLALPVGIYDALCAKTGQTCEVMTNPPEARTKVTVDENGSLNFLVTVPAPTPRPRLQPHPQPGLAASIVAPAMATAAAREPTVTSATDSGYQAGIPYVTDSSERDHSTGTGGDRDAS
jgi:hypothetical protein